MKDDFVMTAELEASRLDGKPANNLLDDLLALSREFVALLSVRIDDASRPQRKAVGLARVLELTRHHGQEFAFAPFVIHEHKARGDVIEIDGVGAAAALRVVLVLEEGEL